MSETSQDPLGRREAPNKNVLLISVQADLSVIGIKYLHYILLREGYNSCFLHMPGFDPRNQSGIDNFREFVSRLNPIFIGLSLMSLEFERAKEISLFLKKHFANTLIIWGGIHPTIDPESCFPFADYACIGEGLRAIVDFAQTVSNGQDVRGIHNLCYMENASLKRNALYPLYENLDELPVCDHIPKNGYALEQSGAISQIDRRILKKHARYLGKFYDIASTLGCQLNCTFCCSSLLSRLYGTNRVRRRGLENIIGELDKAVKDNPYLELINFQDENFLTHNLEFFQGFKDEYRKRVNRPFMFACTPMFVTREKIALLKAAGLVWIRMGLQSGSDRTLKEVFKRKSLGKHFLNAMDIFQEFEIAVYCDVIVDNPFEEIPDYLDTIKTFIQASRPYYLQLYSLTTYHGTELYDKMLKDHPERFYDPTRKDYYEYAKTPQNHLTQIAPYLPRSVMYKLVGMYEQNPEGALFKLSFFAAKTLCVSFFEPVAFYRVFKRAQGGSFLKSLRMLPVYKNIIIERYTKHFKKESWAKPAG